MLNLWTKKTIINLNGLRQKRKITTKCLVKFLKSFVPTPLEYRNVHLSFFAHLWEACARSLVSLPVRNLCTTGIVCHPSYAVHCVLSVCTITTGNN